MPTKMLSASSQSAVLKEYSGKWVAWDANHISIVAEAETFKQLWHIVNELKIHNPVFEKVPHADLRFVGMK